MKRIALLLVAATLSVTPTACGAGHSTGKGSVAAAAGNAFGLDLYRQLAGKETGNLFLSPTSIHAALAMTSAGAGGQTAAQMGRTLHLSAGQGIHAEFAALLEILNTPSKGCQLQIANALWGQTGYPFKPEFTGLIKDNYGGNLSELDFADNAVSAKAINDWVAGQTQDKIKDLISPQDIDKLTRLVLTNAIYFKGSWSAKFEKGATTEGDFKISPGKTVRAMLMHRKGTYGYRQTDAFQMLEMPYVSDEVSMLVFLPRKADGLADFEKSLTVENLAAWLSRIVQVDIDVTFPRFKFTSRFRLADNLKAMGMSDAFDLGRADFSGMTTAEKLYISAVIHKALVAVDEDGTEVAAATGVVVKAAGALEFRADHPFVFLIRHRATGAILFMGRVVEPKTE